MGRVADYVANHLHTPLHYGITADVDSNYATMPLNELVMEILRLCERYHSFNPEGTLETYRSKYRSSLDIWRHVIFHQPNITIYQVMNSLYNNKSLLCSHYCYTVERRVFWRVTWSSHHNDRVDEYGLTFPIWSWIDEKEETSLASLRNRWIQYDSNNPPPQLWYIPRRAVCRTSRGERMMIVRLAFRTHNLRQWKYSNGRNATVISYEPLEGE